MQTTNQEMRLYSRDADRLYLNSAERHRFVLAANRASPEIRRFALTLVYTGMRLSEARYLRSDAFQWEARVLSVRSLKKRQASIIREVPIPQPLVDAFGGVSSPPNTLLWSAGCTPIPRITAYR